MNFWCTWSTDGLKMNGIGRVDSYLFITVQCLTSAVALADDRLWAWLRVDYFLSDHSLCISVTKGSNSWEVKQGLFHSPSASLLLAASFLNFPVHKRRKNQLSATHLIMLEDKAGDKCTFPELLVLIHNPFQTYVVDPYYENHFC